MKIFIYLFMFSTLIGIHSYAQQVDSGKMASCAYYLVSVSAKLAAASKIRDLENYETFLADDPGYLTLPNGLKAFLILDAALDICRVATTMLHSNDNKIGEGIFNYWSWLKWGLKLVL